MLLSGAATASIRAVSSKTGQLLWQFDTAQEFKTVNGVAAQRRLARLRRPDRRQRHGVHRVGLPGISGRGAGQRAARIRPGVRLDEHADELIRKAQGKSGGR